MTSNIHLALFLLFACTVTVSAAEDNFQGENGEKFSQQNGSFRILTRLTSK